MSTETSTMIKSDSSLNLNKNLNKDNKMKTENNKMDTKEKTKMKHPNENRNIQSNKKNGEVSKKEDKDNNLSKVLQEKEKVILEKNEEILRIKMRTREIANQMMNIKNMTVIRKEMSKADNFIKSIMKDDLVKYIEDVGMDEESLKKMDKSKAKSRVNKDFNLKYNCNCIQCQGSMFTDIFSKRTSWSNKMVEHNILVSNNVNLKISYDNKNFMYNNNTMREFSKTITLMDKKDNSESIKLEFNVMKTKSKDNMEFNFTDELTTSIKMKEEEFLTSFSSAIVVDSMREMKINKISLCNQMMPYMTLNVNKCFLNLVEHITGMKIENDMVSSISEMTREEEIIFLSHTNNMDVYFMVDGENYNSDLNHLSMEEFSGSSKMKMHNLVLPNFRNIHFFSSNVEKMELLVDNTFLFGSMSEIMNMKKEEEEMDENGRSYPNSGLKEIDEMLKSSLKFNRLYYSGATKMGKDMIGPKDVINLKIRDKIRESRAFTKDLDNYNKLKEFQCLKCDKSKMTCFEKMLVDHMGWRKSDEHVHSFMDMTLEEEAMIMEKHWSKTLWYKVDVTFLNNKENHVMYRDNKTETKEEKIEYIKGYLCDLTDNYIRAFNFYSEMDQEEYDCIIDDFNSRDIMDNDTSSIIEDLDSEYMKKTKPKSKILTAENKELMNLDLSEDGNINKMMASDRILTIPKHFKEPSLEMRTRFIDKFTNKTLSLMTLNTISNSYWTHSIMNKNKEERNITDLAEFNMSYPEFLSMFYFFETTSEFVSFMSNSKVTGIYQFMLSVPKYFYESFSEALMLNEMNFNDSFNSFNEYLVEDQSINTKFMKKFYKFIILRIYFHLFSKASILDEFSTDKNQIFNIGMNKTTFMIKKKNLTFKSIKFINFQPNSETNELFKKMDNLSYNNYKLIKNMDSELSKIMKCTDVLDIM